MGPRVCMKTSSGYAALHWVTIYDDNDRKVLLQVYAYKIWHKLPLWLTLPLAGRELGDLVLSNWKSLRW